MNRARPPGCFAGRLLALACLAVVATALIGARGDLGVTARTARGGDRIVIRVDPGAGRDRPVTGGVPAEPVATLAHALEIVAALRLNRPAAQVSIDLAPGTHRVARTVSIGPELGGTAAAPLVIRGAADGTTRISGSVALDPVAEPLPAAVRARLPAEALGHVKLYRLPAAALEGPTAQNMSLLRDRPSTVALDVYDGEGALAPARWPAEGWARTAAGSSSPADPGFTVDDARLARWRGEPDLWAEGFWRWDWLFESLPVGDVDAATRRIALPRLPYEGILAGARFRISHALSELGRPGQWWRDRERGLLVAWPRTNDPRLEVAVATTLIEVAASHVRLDDLVLEHARGDLLRVEGARDVVVSRSRFDWAAGRGAVFEGAQDSGLVDCGSTGIGAAAVRLNGGDRRALRPGGLFVRGCSFSRFARLVLTQRPAVEIDGVGATVEKNLFQDAGAPALIIHGNDHRVVGNELTRLLAGIADNGAIYAGRDWTARGTVIEGNYLHDIRADPGLQDKGILLDDFASGFVIRRNLFVRVDQPVFLGGGRDNLVEGNLFVASSPAIHVDSRGETWAANSIADPDSELMAAFRAMPTAAPAWRRRYPGLSGILADEPAVGKNNRLVGNTFLLSEPFAFSDGGRRALQVVARNSGPDGIRSSSGADLGTLAASGTRPDAFADLVDRSGRPVGLDLGASLRRSVPKRPCVAQSSKCKQVRENLLRRRPMVTTAIRRKRGTTVA